MPAPPKKSQRSLLPPQKPTGYREFFVYSTGAVSVGANATVTATIQISADADFEVTKLTARPTNWNFTAQFQDSTTTKNWFDRAVHAEGVLGTALRPHILAIPRRIRGNAAVTVTLADSSGIAQTIWVNLIGHKVYQHMPEYSA